MPELPEAETIVRGLRRTVIGAAFRRVEVLRTDILRQPRPLFSQRLRARSITGIERRGKNVIVRLDDDSVVAVNLGMTGRLLPFAKPPRGADAPKHPAIRFRFMGGGLLVFDDTRRFGTVEVLSPPEWAIRSARMGPEPLAPAYTSARMFRGLQASRAPVRTWLLDQQRIAGVGNIYAAEALYLAGVHPQREARSLTRAETSGLFRGLRRVLRTAIEAGGTTIKDYRNASGGRGAYGNRLHVYGRGDQACHRCASRVLRTVFGGRSAFHCPTCQPVNRPPSAR